MNNDPTLADLQRAAAAHTAYAVVAQKCLTALTDSGEWTQEGASALRAIQSVHANLAGGFRAAEYMTQTAVLGPVWERGCDWLTAAEFFLDQVPKERLESTRAPLVLHTSAVRGRQALIALLR